MRILIILVTIIGLSAVAGSIVIGSRVFDGKVTERPYETGLLWDEIHKEKESSGLSFSIKNKGFTSGDNEVIFTVVGREGKPVAGAVRSLIVSRPSTAAYDRVYPVAGLQNAVHRVKIHLPLYGHWVLKTEVSHNGRTMMFEEKIYAEKGRFSSEEKGQVCEIDKGPCSNKSGDQEVILDIKPKPVREMEELIFTISLKHGDYEKLVLALDMPGMYMGTNEVILKKRENSYIGKGVIPRCVSGRREWRASVNIPEAGRVEFLFNVSY